MIPALAPRLIASSRRLRAVRGANSPQESGVTNLDVNIFCFALFALFIGPPQYRTFAEWVYRLRSTPSHRAHDGLEAAISLLLIGLFWPALVPLTCTTNTTITRCIPHTSRGRARPS